MTLTFKHVLEEYNHIQVKVSEKMMFYSFDLDLYPMAQVLKLDLDIVMMYLNAKNEVPSKSTSLNRRAHKHRQTRVELLPTRIRGW